MTKSDSFKLAILNDLLGDELHKIPLSQILDNSAKCKIKNGMKSTNSLSSYFDEVFGFKTAEVFGDFCIQINKVIDEAIKSVEEISIDDKAI